MQRIADLAEATLQWSQPGGGREYVLTHGSEPVGTLRFRSMFGTLANAKSNDGCWNFKRVGFWKTRATIRACGSDANVAVFENDTWKSGGTLTFASGAAFPVTTSFWKSDLGFRTPAGDPLVRFHYGGVFRRKADVEVAPAARDLPELPLLVMFGWYLALMFDMDAGAAAAVIAATS